MESQMIQIERTEVRVHDTRYSNGATYGTGSPGEITGTLGSERAALATLHGGGLAPAKVFQWNELIDYLPREGDNIPRLDGVLYELLKYTTLASLNETFAESPEAFALDVPISVLVNRMTVEELKSLGRVHGIYVERQDNKSTLTGKLEGHECISDECRAYTAVFVPCRASQELLSLEYRKEYMDRVAATLAVFSFEEITAIVNLPSASNDMYAQGARFVGLVEYGGTGFESVGADEHIVCDPVPWMILAGKGNRSAVLYLAKLHGIPLRAKATRSHAMEALGKHACRGCKHFQAIFCPVKGNRDSPSLVTDSDSDASDTEGATGDERVCLRLDPPMEPKHKYPPEPLPEGIRTDIIREFCQDLQPNNFEEAGCMVCGQLRLVTDLVHLSEMEHSLDPLIEPGIMRLPRTRMSDDLRFESGPVLDKSCSSVCGACRQSLKVGKRPRNALANGLWVGPIPPQLQNLTYAEQCLVARVRSNRCVVRVSMGQAKMMANAISFACPTLKVYKTLPPTREELDDVLAFIFTGVQPPNEDDLERTPMLVRRNKVGRALEWLKLNHVDYQDLNIDYESLSAYPESGIPVAVIFRKTVDDSNVIPAATSVHDSNDEEGASEGKCPLKVNGLFGESLDTMSFDARKAAAAQHLQSGGHVLAVGHSDQPESIYDNPQLYPQMYPWLFPYGVGGVGNARLHGIVSESRQKKWLLLYHDKRFQLDSRFVLVAFNHEQIKTGVTASFILTKRRNFATLVTDLTKVHPEVVKNIANRLLDGERVIPVTEEEKRCFTLMDQIEHVGVSVPGTMAGRKRMRANLWSMMTNKGSPSWFITLSPVDINHPLCLYWADHDVEFKPDLRIKNERTRLIAQNPVAGARFFHYMIQLFIKHILRWGDDDARRGVFGQTDGYFATVEQQGRMTLHLHALIWIACSLSPAEVRERLLSEDNAFKRDLIAYLESAHIGEFLTGTMVEMDDKYCDKRPKGQRRRGNEVDPNDPTQRMPVSPPPAPDVTCDAGCTCERCRAQLEWRSHFERTVDHVMYVSNRHECKRPIEVNKGNGTYSVVKTIAKGCLNKDGVCSARFPREIVEESTVDDKGRLTVKKLESAVNTVNDTMVYCFGCNTDCTCLTSGTAVNATVGYIADYIVKMGLKTHQIFSSIYDVFERNADIWTTSKTHSDAARKLILKMANSLTSKMEIGAPMAAMYLMGHPDNYCSHSFVPLYWKQFHVDVVTSWESATASYDDCANISLPAMATSFTSPQGVEATNPDVVEQVAEPFAHDLDGNAAADSVYVARSGNRVISKSSVDDYKMRPTSLDGVCVYDWVQCSVRVRRSPKTQHRDRDDKCLLYVEGHPLHGTYGVTYDAGRMQTVIPTLLGPSLPRKDADDREFYCCVMLCLFAPWRSGFDLKSSDQSWVDAFDQYPFSPRHRTLMLNMNLRYECYDARDDYRLQMRQRAAALQEELADLEDYLEEDIAPVDGEASHLDLLDDDLLGTWSRRRKDQMAEVEAVMQRAGWAANGALGACRVPDNSFRPERALVPTKWKDLVASERAKEIARRTRGIPNSMDLEDDMDIMEGVINDARIVPGSYLSAEFKVLDIELVNLKDEVISHFALNAEQERAFSIVANHSMSMRPAPLRMYIGGMGGTGKTTVIKALRRWFKGKGQPYRMIVLAPTGAAAAIVVGSTYHSFLGIRTGDRQALGSQCSGALEDARLRMQGVDYIFLDEISMVSCQDLYLIDSRLKDIAKSYDLPFGGINVVVAGDFAQLPPAKGLSLYSGDVTRGQVARQTKSDQENTLGLLVWHQFVTVVILTQNMRQISQDHPDEAQLRDTLLHMRYKDCTEKDIAFLQSRVPLMNPRLSLQDPVWKDVSVITAWNTHKDQINAMSAQRFALEHNEELHYFYSIDKETQKRGKRRGGTSRQHTSLAPVRLTPMVQEALWRSPPYTSEHIPACLPLCRGMPIMIRNNDATELCITKGQEAVVKGWTCHEIAARPGKYVLDTLFVELLVPSSTEVQLPFLPKNVVPLCRISTPLSATLPNDRVINITRQQVPILLNFAMTDYASQGKTRPVNVVDLKHCRNHQAMYTALSRGMSAKDTLIVREFSTNKITGGLSGYLRQEFRDLETLDQITTLQYGGTLPPGIVQHLRDSTIREFKTWRNKQDALSSNVKIGIKRTLDSDAEDRTAPQKPPKRCKAATSKPMRCAHGDAVRMSWKWDSRDWSCAYDAYLTILYCVWDSDPMKWTNEFQQYGPHMNAFAGELIKYRMGVVPLEAVRQRVRGVLWALSEDDFPRGAVGTDLYTLVRVMNGYSSFIAVHTLNKQCTVCHIRVDGNPFENIGKYIMMSEEHRWCSVAEYLASLESSFAVCPSCGGPVSLIHSHPPMICVQLPPASSDEGMPLISSAIKLRGHSYSISGVVYWSCEDYHFASRIIDRASHSSRYDGMVENGRLVPEPTLTVASPEGEATLRTMGHRYASLVVYTRDAEL